MPTKHLWNESEHIHIRIIRHIQHLKIIILRPSFVLLVILLTNQSSCSLNRFKLAFQKSAGEDSVNQQAFDNEEKIDKILTTTMILKFELPRNEDWPIYAPYFRFAGEKSSFNSHFRSFRPLFHIHPLQKEADIFKHCIDHQDRNR